MIISVVASVVAIFSLGIMFAPEIKRTFKKNNYERHDSIKNN